MTGRSEIEGWENYLVRLGLTALDRTHQESTPTSRERFERHIREQMRAAAKTIHMEIEKAPPPYARPASIEVLIRDLVAEVPIGRRPEAIRKVEGICRTIVDDVRSHYEARTKKEEG